MALNLSNFSSLRNDHSNLAALWKLRLIGIGELQEIASDLLSQGFASDQLIDILVCSKEDGEKISPLFDKFLSESGAVIATDVDALRQLAIAVSSLIISGEVSPEEGARFLWDAALKSGDSEFHELDEFIYAASEMIDRAEDRSFFEEAIRNEAERWVGR